MSYFRFIVAIGNQCSYSKIVMILCIYSYMLIYAKISKSSDCIENLYMDT